MFHTIIARGEEVALGFEDIRAICRDDVNIVEFSDLDGIRDYKQLFAKNRRVILFWEVENENVGHYNTLLYKTENRSFGVREYVEFFDSYGKSIDEVFNLAGYDYSLFKGVNPLRRILQGIQVNQNEVKFQSANQQIATCGRYASLRCRFYLMDNTRFSQFLKGAKIPPDQLVTAMTIIASDIDELISAN